MNTGKFLDYHAGWVVSPSLDSIHLGDHLGGFNTSKKSQVFDKLLSIATERNIRNIHTGYVFNQHITNQYPDNCFVYNESLVGGSGWEKLKQYNIHPKLQFKNFICSFNGSAHVSRKLLVSILEKFRWFNPKYCSKNFSYSPEILDGHIYDCVGDLSNFYSKFFIEKNSKDFFQSIVSFGHIRFDHRNNIYNLEHKLTQSFLHIVSETLATSYYPFVTEKFLYSIVTRGLFLAYAQPGWHTHLEKYYGFKQYTKLFDYGFDTIQNPVERLVELMTMISKFSVLSSDDWKDLYLLEQDIIEYNYNHYFSGDYLKHLTEHGQ